MWSLLSLPLPRDPLPPPLARPRRDLNSGAGFSAFIMVSSIVITSHVIWSHPRQYHKVSSTRCSFERLYDFPHLRVCSLPLSWPWQRGKLGRCANWVR